MKPLRGPYCDPSVTYRNRIGQLSGKEAKRSTKNTPSAPGGALDEREVI